MHELVVTAGEKWFDAMRNPDLLLSADASPFRAELIAAFGRVLNAPEAIVTSPQARQALNVE
jgi:hypothetical protein